MASLNVCSFQGLREMPFRMKCSAGHSLMVPDSRAGKTVRCPRCEGLVEVPLRPRAVEPLESEVAAVTSAPPEVDSAPLPNTVYPKTDLPPETPVAPPVIVPAVAKAEATIATLVVKPVVAAPVVQKTVVQKTVAAVVANEGAFAPAIVSSPLVVVAAKEVSLLDVNPPSKPVPEAKVTPPVVPVKPALPPLPKTETHTPSPTPSPVPTKPITSAPPLAAQPSKEAIPAASETPAATSPSIPAATIDPSTQLWGKQIALGLLVTALFSSAPGLWDLVDYLRNPEEMFVARWALVLLVLGTLQVAYATYLWQLADWTSLWVVTLMSLAIASGFAMMLGIVLVAGEESQFVAALQLQDRLIGNKAHLWCLCMIAVYTVVAFFAGRACTHWHRREQLLEALSLS